MQRTTIEPAELGQLLLGRPGLTIGPVGTLNINSLSGLLAAIASNYKPESGMKLVQLCDQAVSSEHSENEIRQFIRGWLEETTAAANVDVIARANWAAVLVIFL